MRRRATPVPPAMLMGGMIGSSVIVSLLLVVITTGFGAAVFSTGFPHNVLLLLIGLVLGAVCFCSLGIAVQTFVKDADSAPPLINLPLMALSFISGNFFEINSQGTVGRIASYFPLQHLNNIIRAAFDRSGHGFGLRGIDVLNLVIWTAVGLRIGARRFKWAPSTT